jgi:hypothetical protein
MALEIEANQRSKAINNDKKSAKDKYIGEPIVAPKKCYYYNKIDHLETECRKKAREAKLNMGESHSLSSENQNTDLQRGKEAQKVGDSKPFTCGGNEVATRK